jgi:hypothetical protein
MKTILASMILLAGVPGFMLAGSVVSPEVDAASGITAISAIAGAVLILRGRRRKQS